MTWLTDRTMLFIILAFVVITAAFVIFTKDEAGEKKFTVPFLKSKTDEDGNIKVNETE